MKPRGSSWLLALTLATSFQLAAQEPPFALPETVRMLPGRVYAQPDSVMLRLDLFLPRVGEGPFPAVVFAYGGSFGRGRGDRSQFWRQAVHLARKGIVSATIEYRFEPGAPFPAGLNDLQSAVRWLRANAEEYHVDPRRIAVAGGSTGGYLAALAGTNRWAGSDWSGAPAESRVQAVVAFNAALDLPAFAGRDIFNNSLGVTFEQNPAAWRDASPMTHIGHETAPFLLLHGTADESTPYAQSVNMQRGLRNLGIRAELFTADGAAHGFFNRPPWYEPTQLRMEKFLMEVLNVAEASPSGQQGSWGSVLALPTHPEQMAVLPSGKVLMWPWAPERKTPPHGPVALWDPTDGSSITYPGAGMESASGLAFQPDGVLLSAGGDMPSGGVNGNSRTFTFDFASERLAEVASMAGARVFPSATTLGNGQILVMAGLDADKEINGVPELWHGGRWTALPEALNVESRGPTFAFLAPDGRVFRAGPETLTDWLDVETGHWSDVEAKDRNDVRHQGAAVMYDIGKILLVGGCPVGPESGWNNQCSDTVLKTAEVIDLSEPSPTWRPVAPMAFPRHSHQATLLPDGTVLITGGTARPGIFNDSTAGILDAELWNPATETFSTVAPMTAPRHFQSTAVLLADGRVLVAGGAFGSSDVDARFSWSGQVFSPPYLHRGPRPSISAAPASVRYGQRFTLETPDASTVSRVTLVRLSASSQTWNGGQRLAQLGFAADSGRLTLEVPADPNLIPPGYYLLFVLNDLGVPSTGQILRVGQG